MQVYIVAVDVTLKLHKSQLYLALAFQHRLLVECHFPRFPHLPGVPRRPRVPALICTCPHTAPLVWGPFFQAFLTHRPRCTLIISLYHIGGQFQISLSQTSWAVMDGSYCDIRQLVLRLLADRPKKYSGSCSRPNAGSAAIGIVTYGISGLSELSLIGDNRLSLTYHI